MASDFNFALLIMLVGLIGSIAPLIPGPPIVWLGALYYAWRTDFNEIGLISLGLLAILAIIGGTADWWLAYLGARRGGASGWTTLASFVGGILGFFVLPGPGILIGAIAAVILAEYLRHRDWRRVWSATSGFVVGSLLAAVVEVGICLLMIALFLVDRRV